MSIPNENTTEWVIFWNADYTEKGCTSKENWDEWSVDPKCRHLISDSDNKRFKSHPVSGTHDEIRAAYLALGKDNS